MPAAGVSSSFRTTRRLSLAAEGQTFIKQVRDVLRAIDEVEFGTMHRSTLRSASAPLISSIDAYRPPRIGQCIRQLTTVARKPDLPVRRGESVDTVRYR